MMASTNFYKKTMINVQMRPISYMLSDGLKRFLGEIESDNLTVSNSEIITFDFHCL